MEREDFNGMNLNEDISDEDFNKIVGIYEQIKDKISKEEFISVFNENKELNKDFSFYTDLYCAKRILDNLGPAENEILDEVSGNVLKISDVEVGNENFDIVARVMSISNSRAFVSGKGRDGKLCNLEVADNTGRVRVVLWTQNVKHVKFISEGDIVRIGDIECREGYQGGKEFTLNPRSSIKRLEEGSRDYPNDIDLYPDYYEEFTAISDLRPNEQANIRGRLIRYPTPHKFNSNGRDGRVVSLEIQDESGKMELTREMIDDITFEDVTFRYGTRKDVFEGLSLKFRKGQTTAIVGESGSGKTTTLLRTIAELRDEYKIGVMEADIDASVDAEKMIKAGVRSIQRARIRVQDPAPRRQLYTSCGQSVFLTHARRGWSHS